MKSLNCVLLSFAVCATLLAQAPKPKHINRAIELLEQGQPVYYTGSHSGTEGSFEQGKKDAQTYYLENHLPIRRISAVVGQ